MLDFVTYCECGAGSLFKACVDGDAAYVELLINNGMSPNTCDYNQRTPLHLAASNGHTHIVHFLCNQAVSDNIHISHPQCSAGPDWTGRGSAALSRYQGCSACREHSVLCLSAIDPSLATDCWCLAITMYASVLSRRCCARPFAGPMRNMAEASHAIQFLQKMLWRC